MNIIRIQSKWNKADGRNVMKINKRKLCVEKGSESLD